MGMGKGDVAQGKGGGGGVGAVVWEQGIGRGSLI